VAQTNTGQWSTVPKAQQAHTGPVLDVAWSDVSVAYLHRSVTKSVSYLGWVKNIHC